MEQAAIYFANGRVSNRIRNLKCVVLHIDGQAGQAILTQGDETPEEWSLSQVPMIGVGFPARSKPAIHIPTHIPAFSNESSASGTLLWVLMKNGTWKRFNFDCPILTLTFAPKKQEFFVLSGYQPFTPPGVEMAQVQMMYAAATT